VTVKFENKVESVIDMLYALNLIIL